MAVEISPFYFRKSLPMPKISRVQLDAKSLNNTKKHEFGCLMAEMPEDVCDQVKAWIRNNIPADHLGIGGAEDHIHITIKYGFRDSSKKTVNGIKEYLSSVEPFPVRLSKVSLFEGNKDGDVLKVDIDSPKLHRINQEITARFDCEDKYPTYLPHTTLAYVDPSYSHFYSRMRPEFLGREVLITSVQWLGSDGKREMVVLGNGLTTGRKNITSKLRKVCESFSDIDGLGPDYNNLYWNEKEKKVWWVSFDGDEEESVREVIRRLENVEGVDEVIAEAEHSPKNDDKDWTFVWGLNYRQKTMSAYNEVAGGALVGSGPPKRIARSPFADRLLGKGNHRPGDKWQGQSGRWFTMTQENRVVPTEAPGGGEQPGPYDKHPKDNEPPKNLKQSVAEAKSKIIDHISKATEKAPKKAQELYEKAVGKVADKMSEKARERVKKFVIAPAMYAEHQLQKFTHASQKMVSEVARQQGLSDEGVKRVEAVTKWTDFALSWTVNIPTLHHALVATGVGGVAGFMAAKFAYYVPVASLLYITGSTVATPLATIRAADKLIRGGTESERHKALEQEKANLFDEESTKKLCELYKTAEDKDWLEALMCVAVDKTHDAAKSVEEVSKLLQTHPTDPDKKQEVTVPDVNAMRVSGVKGIVEKKDKRGYRICYNDETGTRVACNKVAPPKVKPKANKKEDKEEGKKKEKEEKKPAKQKATAEEAKIAIDKAKEGGIDSNKMNSLVDTLNDMTVAELQKLRKVLGAKTASRKADIIEKLKENLTSSSKKESAPKPVPESKPEPAPESATKPVPESKPEPASLQFTSKVSSIREAIASMGSSSSEEIENEINALKNQEKELRKGIWQKLTGANNAKLAPIVKRLNELSKNKQEMATASRTKLIDMLKGDVKLNPKIKEGTSNFNQIANEGCAFISSILKDDLMSTVEKENGAYGIQFNQISNRDAQRAFYKQDDLKKDEKNGIVHLSKYDDSATAVHELGHWIEANIPGIKRAANDFIAKRFGNEKPINLREMYANYGFNDYETGRKDNFDKLWSDKNDPRAYYVGKSYSDGSTEIISMGIEEMYRDPSNFAKKDPEYFEFIVSILEGSGRYGRKTYNMYNKEKKS